MRKIALIMLLCLVSEARADDKKAAVGVWVHGNTLFNEATKLEDAGELELAQDRFVAAAREYVRAHDLYQFEEVLFNAAQAKRRGGLIESALVSYRLYLRTYPESTRIAMVRKRIFELEALIRWSDARLAKSCKDRRAP